jgi:YHS domain-containing protein
MRDIVCGMEVDPRTATEHSEVNGEMYYFCSHECKDRFDKDPAFFVENAMSK